MKKCALLSMDNLNNFECYDYLLKKPMSDLGWATHEISWRSQVDWNDFDAVIVRSTWDYQDDCDAFVRVLEKISSSNALLANPLELMKWNINKNYLLELEREDVLIIPTIWRNKCTEQILKDAAESFDTNQVIIKPCISAGADDTYRLNLTKSIDYALLENKFRNRECMIQPFMSSVISEGEFSLFYFNGKFSHSILKKPKSDDFRVQEEHGGLLLTLEPEARLLETANHVLKKIPLETLYARLDFVRHGNEFAMMEAELIEPSLYFNLDQNSPKRFAKAFVEYFESQA